MAPSHTRIVSDTTAVADLSVFAFSVLADAVFTKLDGVTGFSGVTFPANAVVFGNITAVTLASGTVVLYLK